MKQNETAIEKLDKMIVKVKAAQAQYATFPQEKVDKILAELD